MWDNLPLKNSPFLAVPTDSSLSSEAICIINVILPGVVAVYSVCWYLYAHGLLTRAFWAGLGAGFLRFFRGLGSALRLICGCGSLDNEELMLLDETGAAVNVAEGEEEEGEEWPTDQKKNARAAFIDPAAGVECADCLKNTDCPMRTFHVLYHLIGTWRWLLVPSLFIGGVSLLFDVLLVLMPDNPPEVRSDVNLERLNSAAAPWNVLFLLLARLVAAAATAGVLNVKLNSIPLGRLKWPEERRLLYHLQFVLVAQLLFFLPAVVASALTIQTPLPLHFIWTVADFLLYLLQIWSTVSMVLRIRRRFALRDQVTSPPPTAASPGEHELLHRFTGAPGSNSTPSSPSALINRWESADASLEPDGCGCACCSARGIFRPKTANVEQQAPFFSKITFSFLSPMVALGFSRPLEVPDLMELPANLQVERSEEDLSVVWEQFRRSKGVNAGLFHACVHYSRWTFVRSAVLKFLADSLNYAQPLLLSTLTKFLGKCQWALHSGGVGRTPVGTLFLEGFGITLGMFCTALLYTALLHQYFHGQMKQGLRLRAGLTGMIYRKALAVDFTDSSAPKEEAAGLEKEEEVSEQPAGKTKTKTSSSSRRCCGTCCRGKQQQREGVKKASTTGEVVNLMAVDASRIADSWGYICLLWSSPYMIVVALALLWRELGVAMLPGIGVILFSVPLSMFISRALRKQQRKLMNLRDERIKVTNEVLAGIKIIKVYAWEQSFRRKIAELREAELRGLWRYQMLGLTQRVMWTGLPTLVAIASFVTYVATDHELTAATAFTSIALFNNLQFPLATLPMVVTFCNEAQVAAVRIREFLLRKEVRPLPEVPPKALRDPKSPTIRAEHLSLRWPNQVWLVDDLSFEAYPGTITAVVGRTGVGKSGLIAALIGELAPAPRTLDGQHTPSLQVSGRLAYVAQTSWIVNDTLRNNILFGRPFNAKWYAQVLQACALVADLEILPAGDQTEIGEKGVNLSGGQKQRVSLARAVYRCGDAPATCPEEMPADIVLLDDPLSAVDSHVGKHIFEKCIKSLLRRRGCTVILVTHKVDILPEVDRIIFLEGKTVPDGTAQMGVCLGTGTHAQLRSNPLYLSLTEDLQGAEKSAGAGASSPESNNNNNSHHNSPTAESVVLHEEPCNTSPEIPRNSSVMTTVSVRSYAKKFVGLEEDAAARKKKQAEGGLIATEEVEKGNVGRAVYLAYFRGMGGMGVVGLVLLLLLVTNGANVGQNYWISYWSDHSDKVRGMPTGIAVYSAFGVANIVVNGFVHFSMALASQKASRYFHLRVITRILRAPMSFFDATPLGRIINRFSKDMNVIDQLLPATLVSWVTMVFSVLSTFTVIIIALPVFVCVVIPLTFVYIGIQKYYIPGSRQMQRLESVMRSPIFALFSETLDGASTIRAYRESERFMQVHFSKSRKQIMAQYPLVTSNRWLAVRLETIGTICTGFAALFAVIQAMRGNLLAGLGALAVTYALSVTQALNWLVRQASDLESNVVSVERLREYGERCPQEAPLAIAETKPKADWPTEGRIVFEQYKLRYRPKLPLVIKGLSFEIQPREKVGIVGRTGAGKSSLLIGVLRIVEPAAESGRILVDGVDIARIGLDDLRTRFSIIPQDPVMFTGTLRFNVDPFDSCDDETVWWALERAHVAEFVRSSIAGGLQGEIAEGGRNLSVGQRQLFCLARALLRKNKILLLDEATSAVDPVTDKLIQTTIRKEFAECTILTIAHRIGTILDYDKVLVMDQGLAAEFDSPTRLLNTEGSIFRSLCANAGYDVDSGLTAAELLRAKDS